MRIIHMPNKLIDIVGVSKSYGDNLVLDDLNLYIEKMNFSHFLGPSGCGKTTLLRILGVRKSGLRKSNFRWKGHYIPCTE